MSFFANNHFDYQIFHKDFKHLSQFLQFSQAFYPKSV